MRESTVFLVTALLALLCASAAHTEDKIEFTGAVETGFIVDALYGTDDCVSNKKFNTPSPAEIGNAKLHADCATEVVGFAKNSAVDIQDSPAFTNADTDVIPLSRAPRVPLQVDFWFVGGVIDDQDSLTKPEIVALLTVELADASMAFADSRAGIEFTMGSVTFVERQTYAEEVAKAADDVFMGTASPEDYRNKIAEEICLGDLGDTCSHQINTSVINVFIVEYADQARGFHISKPDGAPTGEVMIRFIPEPGTLGHELGHALSLDHVNFIGSNVVDRTLGEYCVAFGHMTYYKGTCDYPQENLMWAGQTNTDRNSLTEGQGFRASVNDRSFVNHVNLRPGKPQRQCADWQYGPDCPYLALEVEVPDDEVDEND